MADNTHESADDVIHTNDVKYKILYPVFMKELQKRMKLECRDGQGQI